MFGVTFCLRNTTIISGLKRVEFNQEIFQRLSDVVKFSRMFYRSHVQCTTYGL